MRLKRTLSGRLRFRLIPSGMETSKPLCAGLGWELLDVFHRSALFSVVADEKANESLGKGSPAGAVYVPAVQNAPSFRHWTTLRRTKG